jgi:hypothetical protein
MDNGINKPNWPFPDDRPVSQEESFDDTRYNKRREDATLVVGTTNLYRNGKLRLIPVSPHKPRSHFARFIEIQC